MSGSGACTGMAAAIIKTAQRKTPRVPIRARTGWFVAGRGTPTRGFAVRRLAIFPYYHVSQLTYDFLNPATRSQTLLPYVLLEVK